MQREQVLRILRIILGMLQVTAAATAAILLFRSGVNNLSLGVAAVAGTLMLASRLLFSNPRS